MEYQLRVSPELSHIFMKKDLIRENFLVWYTHFRRNRKGTGKKVLTYHVCSDNQNGNQVIFVYKIEFGPALMSCWGLIKGGFGYG